MTDYTKNPMHCPRDPSIECLKCPFEHCVYDEDDDEHPLDRNKRAPMTEREKELHREQSKRYYANHREEVLAKRNTPEFKEYMREYHKQLYSDPAKLAERRRRNLEYYYRNREAILEKGRIERAKKNESIKNQVEENNNG